MSAVSDLLLATNNSKKLKEIRATLGNDFTGRILCAADFPEFPEPEETGITFAENARIKADYYCNATGLLTLADDSGLLVDALGGRPGVHSARYAPTDQERIEKLLAELNGIAPENRTARFVCALCAAIPGGGSYIEEEGTMEGAIGLTPAGNNGFGYDPIFLVAGRGISLAELDPELKNSISHRGNAMKKLRIPLLKALQNVGVS